MGVLVKASPVAHEHMIKSLDHMLNALDILKGHTTPARL